MQKITENVIHKQLVIKRKRDIELQKLDNLIDSMLVETPKYTPVKKNKKLGISLLNMFRP